MHQLKLLPITFPEVKVRVVFPFELGNLITLVCKLSKVRYRL